MSTKKMARYVGALLLVAQICNIIISLPSFKGAWTMRFLWGAISNLPVSNLTIWIGTTALAIFMMVHNKFYLKIVLMTVGYYIFNNLIDFNHRIEVNGFFMTVGSLIGNVAFFGFILRFYLRKKNQPIIEFEGVGRWARLAKVTDSFVHVELILEPPPQIDTRLLELQVEEDLIVKLRFDHKNGDEYIFRRIS